ncbi:unnamed protein product [Calicophoron daubneyi]|uniref:NUDE domain-containing protein n=1 Tax=Calicophoron daubneyi TaxID=300641 RepID=A0AAV2TUU0_CALDB
MRHWLHLHDNDSSAAAHIASWSALSSDERLHFPLRPRTDASVAVSMEHPVFENPSAEADYWRQKAEEYRQQLEDAREELEDFQVSSRELELELETQLDQLEKRNNELVLLSEKLTSERDDYRNRVENSQSHLSTEVTQLQEELTKHKEEREKMHRYIRELEQTNDDLERSKRAAVVSLEDFESRLNQAIERNAILENELDEKEDLMVTVQRLKDETRDLRQELAITRRQPAANGTAGDSSMQFSEKVCKETPAQTDSFSTSLLTPSVRLAALNMVNDALQKIGQLEFKLSTLYRSYGAPPLSIPPNPMLHPLSANPSFGDYSNNDAAHKRQAVSQSWSNGQAVLDRGSVKSASQESPLRVMH